MKRVNIAPSTIYTFLSLIIHEKAAAGALLAYLYESDRQMFARRYFQVRPRLRSVAVNSAVVCLGGHRSLRRQLLIPLAKLYR